MSGLGEEEKAAIIERVRRSINNVSELRELLQELLNTDPDFAQTLQGPPVSDGANRQAAPGHDRPDQYFMISSFRSRRLL